MNIFDKEEQEKKQKPGANTNINPASIQYRRKVTDDLIKRLEQRSPLSQEILNNPALTGQPSPIQDKPSIKEMNDRLEKQMAETLKRYSEDIHGKTPEKINIDEDKVDGDKVGMEPVCDDKLGQAAFEELQTIVNSFNKSILHWHEKRGCVANFSWVYIPHKQLEIAGIDCIIYRKPPPSPKTMKEIVNQAP